MISYWLFTFAGKNTNIGREKDKYFVELQKMYVKIPTPVENPKSNSMRKLRI